MNVVVSDHALERYRTRVGSKLPDEDLRGVLSELVRPAALARARRYAHDGVTFCLKHTADAVVLMTVYVGTLDASWKRAKVSRAEGKTRMTKAGKRR